MTSANVPWASGAQGAKSQRHFQEFSYKFERNPLENSIPGVFEVADYNMTSVTVSEIPGAQVAKSVSYSVVSLQIQEKSVENFLPGTVFLIQL